MCELDGLVPGSAITGGSGLTFRQRPFPAVELRRHGSLELTVSVTPDAAAPGFTLAIDGPADYPIERLASPGRLRLAGRSTEPWRFAVPLAEGLSFPADRGADTARRLPREVEFYGDWITLPAVAVTRGADARAGGMVVMSPQGDDHGVRLLPAEGGQGPGFELLHDATLGRFGYRREWRIMWVPEPGLAPLAGMIRSELRAAGIEMAPLPEKLIARGMSAPLVESVGGTHLWWHVDRVPSWLPRRLRREGVRSVALMGRFEREAEQEARAAEMVAGTYFMSSDIYPPGQAQLREWRNLFPPEGFEDGWPSELARTREGWLRPNWVHTPAPDPVDLWASEEYLTEDGAAVSRPRAAEEFLPTQGYFRCPHFHESSVRRSALPVMESMGATGVLCDVTTAAGAIECFSPSHPCDRRTDTRRRQEQLELLGAGGRLVSSECAKWWAVDHADAFEGALKYEHHLNNRVLGDYPFRPEWWDTQFDLEHRIPLFGLVARHAAVRTLWWGHGHDRHAETWGAKDAFCAVFGASPIFVADPAHPLRPDTPKWERFLRTVRAFDLLRQRTFGLGIRSYEVLGRHVAVTEFDDGTQVRANVGPVDADALPAGSFEVRDEHGRGLWPADR